MKKQSFIINHGTYPFDVMVCIGNSHKEVLSLLNRRGYIPDEQEKEELWMTGGGRTVMLKSGATVLRLDLPPKKERNYHGFEGFISHEIFHAVEFLFNRIGLKHDSDISSEAFAYQIQHLTSQIFKKLKK